MPIVQLAFAGVAHIHTPGFINAIKKRPGEVVVKNVWDHNKKRGEIRAAELNARFDADLNTMLDDPAIDAVIVCSETHHHGELVREIAKRKKHLFVEKPLGFGAADSAEMVDAIRASNKIFQTGYFMRGQPIVNFLRDEIAKGTFGKITRIRGSNCHGGALGGWFDAKPNDVANDWRWMADPQQSGVGAFGDLGTHLLDLMIWMMGQVSEVTATLDPGTSRYPNCDETGEAILRFKNGAIGTLAAGWDDLANPVPLMVSGTEAHATIIDGKLFLNCKKLGADGKSPWTELPAEKPSGFIAFLDAISGKHVDLVTAEEAAYRSVVMKAVYRAAREKKWVGV